MNYYFNPKEDLKFRRQPQDDYERFVERLKILIKARGLNYKTTSELLGITPQLFSQYINNSRRMGWGVINKLAKQGFSLDYLFNIQSEEMKNN